MAAKKTTGNTSQTTEPDETEFDEITPAGAVEYDDGETLDLSSFEFATPDEGMVKQGRKQFYKPEVCKEAPIKGYLLKEELLNSKTMGTIDKEGNKEPPNVAYIVKLLNPTWAFCKKDEKPTRYQAKAGSLLYIPAKWELNEFHEKLRKNPAGVYTVYAKPLKKIPHPKFPMRSIWRWDVRIGGAMDRRQNFPETCGESLLALPEAGQVTQIIVAPSDIRSPAELSQGNTGFNYGHNQQQAQVGRQ